MRGTVVITSWTDARQETDRSRGPGEDESRPCAVCGDVPERIIQIVEQVVELPLAEHSGVPEVAP
jgi:hypothetical protein